MEIRVSATGHTLDSQTLTDLKQSDSSFRFESPQSSTQFDSKSLEGNNQGNSSELESAIHQSSSAESEIERPGTDLVMSEEKFESIEASNDTDVAGDGGESQKVASSLSGDILLDSMQARQEGDSASDTKLQDESSVPMCPNNEMSSRSDISSESVNDDTKIVREISAFSESDVPENDISKASAIDSITTNVASAPPPPPPLQLPTPQHKRRANRRQRFSASVTSPENLIAGESPYAARLRRKQQQLPSMIPRSGVSPVRRARSHQSPATTTLPAVPVPTSRQSLQIPPQSTIDGVPRRESPYEARLRRKRAGGAHSEPNSPIRTPPRSPTRTPPRSPTRGTPPIPPSRKLAAYPAELPPPGAAAAEAGETGDSGSVVQDLGDSGDNMSLSPFPERAFFTLGQPVTLLNSPAGSVGDRSVGNVGPGVTDHVSAANVEPGQEVAVPNSPGNILPAQGVVARSSQTPNYSGSLSSSISAPFEAVSNQGPAGYSEADFGTYSIRSLDSGLDALRVGQNEGDLMFANQVGGGRITTAHRVHLTARQPKSYSELPMERRGSFIDGGEGPLESDCTPGAFTAVGRAFGDMPEWMHNARTARLQAEQAASSSSNNDNTNDDSNSECTNKPSATPPRPSLLGEGVSSAQDLRVSTEQGSFIVKAKYSREHSGFQSIPEGEERESFIALARPVEESGRSEVPDEFTRGETEGSVENEGLSVADVDDVSYAEVVEDEEVKLESLKTAFQALCCICGVLVIILTVLLVLAGGPGSRKDEGDNMSLRGSDDTMPRFHRMFPLNGTLPDLQTICNNDRDEQSLVVSCYCNRPIMHVPASVLISHSTHGSVLVDADVIPKIPLMTDCADPINVALLWLAEDQRTVVSAEHSTNLFVLSLLFHAMGGLEWKSRDYWLSSYSSCIWEGVKCDEGRIAHIYLDDNNLRGSIPEQLAGLKYLQTLDLSMNPQVTGVVPYELSSQNSSIVTMKVAGTSIEDDP